MKNAKAVILDMDGVIVDSEIHWKSLGDKAMSEFFEGWSDVDNRKITGMSVRNIYRSLKDCLRVNITMKEFERKYDEMAKIVYREKTKLIPGIMEFMNRLSEDKIPMALVSSSPRFWIDMVMDRFKLRKFFTLIISSDDLDGKGKPAPDIFLLAAKRLGILPKDCLVIEDSENGVESAKAAGMFCVGFRNGFNRDYNLSRADIIVDGLNKIDIGEA